MATEKKSLSPLETAMKGCYGPKMKPSQVKEWIVENVIDNIERQNNKRITLDVMGVPGCVFKDTKITVRKISDENGHRIFVK